VNSGGGRLALIVAFIALLVSLGTAVYCTALRDRDSNGGDRLAKYDFTTPEKAYISSLRIAAEGDVLARMQLNGRFAAVQAREQLSTMAVRKTLNHGGKMVLFVRFERHGKERRRVRWFEYDRDARMWRRAYNLEFGGGMNVLPDDMLRQIEEWVTHDEDDPETSDIDW
jgi:hypothetical protein